MVDKKGEGAHYAQCSAALGALWQGSSRSGAMRGSEDSPASMSDLHFAVGPAQRRYSPPQLTAPACAARLHILASLWLSNVRAQRVLAGAMPLSCTPEWHEPAGLSPSRPLSLTASSLLVDRCAPETLIAWSTPTASFCLLPYSVDLRADEAAGAGFEAQAGRSWSTSCSASTVCRVCVWRLTDAIM